MVMNRLTHCWNNLLIFLLLTCFIVSIYCSQCPNSKELEKYNADCWCEPDKVGCRLGGAVASDSPFWTLFSSLDTTPADSTSNQIYSPTHLSIYDQDTTPVYYFPTKLFENLPTTIEEINLSAWKFTSIPPFKVPVKSSIKTLTIRNSDNFTTIDRPKAFDPISYSLERLILTTNQLQVIDKSAFHGLKNIIEVDLGDNNLTFLHVGLFKDSVKLTNLSLKKNAITAIQRKTFRGLVNLKDLQLNGNKLFTVKNNTFQEMTNLRLLDLSHNEINSLEPLAFRGLSLLESIDLSNNQLRDIPPGLLTYSKVLENIDLKHNQLTRLSDTFLQQLPKTINIFLKDNQWICNCNLWIYSDILLADNSRVNCSTSSHGFNENGKLVEMIEMTFELYINTTRKNPKQCNSMKDDYYNNNKEKRSHLTMVSTSKGGRQTITNVSLVQALVLNVLWLYKFSSQLI